MPIDTDLLRDMEQLHSSFASSQLLLNKLVENMTARIGRILADPRLPKESRLSALDLMTVLEGAQSDFGKTKAGIDLLLGWFRGMGEHLEQ